MKKKNNRTVSAKRMQALDRKATEEQKIPSIILMENAGRGAAEEIFLMLRHVLRPKVCIVCGSGNNGGDGFVVARHLKIAGVFVQCFLTADPQALKGDALVQFRIVKNSGIEVRSVEGTTVQLERSLRNSHITVDALFGIGLNRRIEEPFCSVIHAINEHSRKVVALDIPSGLDATTGRIWGCCVKADRTVTFQAVKSGLCKGEGPKQCGRLTVCHIGTDLKA